MLKRSITLGVSISLTLTMGCISPKEREIPVPRSLGRSSPTFHTTAAADNSVKPDLIEIQEPLSLRAALVLALMQNPELEAFAHDVRAQEAHTLQAGLLPNPEIELEVDAFDRDGEGYDSSEPSVMLGQTIELGRKRHWRVQVAAARGDLAGWDYESKRLDVFTGTAQRFTDVIAAQHRVELANALMTLAEKTCQTVGERVSAGKEPPVQRTKTVAELEMARLQTTDAEIALLSARNALSAMWGSDQPGFQRATGDFGNVLNVLPSIELLRVQLAANPDLVRRENEILLQQATLDAAKAERIPNLKVAAGVKRFEEDGTHALIFGVGVPLPIFDRNQGNIAAAKHELAKAQAEERATSIKLAIELVATHSRLTSAHNRTQVLQSKVIPALQAAYDAVHSGYQQGKYGILDVLDAQRNLFTTKNEVIDALADYHMALNEIERLTGVSIAELLESKEDK